MTSLLRTYGATEVHVRISCPPTRHPCFYGIDFASETELIAANRTVEEIRAWVGSDSLGYLSEEGLLAPFPEGATRFCRACFDGHYPVEVTDRQGKLAHETGAIPIVTDTTTEEIP